MPGPVAVLPTYVPALLLRDVAGGAAPPQRPYAHTFPAATLFADISGFTPLAERLARRGPAGAEELSRLLNAYFGELIDVIGAHGGEVVRFAGDALLAAWPVLSPAGALRTATERAAGCALAIQRQLHDWPAAADVRLSVHVGVGAGQVTATHVGGVDGRWEFLLTGAPLIQMSLASQRANPGDAVLSPEAVAQAPEQFAGVALPGGFLQLHEVRAAHPAGATPAYAAPAVDGAVRAYVLDSVLHRLDAGQVDWLAELRRVTVLFVSVDGIAYDAPDTVAQLQRVMESCQVVLRSYEGSVRQFIFADKGTVLIAVFGLPPHAHEDDAVRGVLAALAISRRLEESGLRAAIGVTTGRAFCGPIGSNVRREYDLVGDVVNLAARLMAAAGPEHGVLCDEATQLAAHAHVAFTALPALYVKGKTEPVAVYRPARQVLATMAAGQAFAPHGWAPLVGRTAERSALAARLAALLRDGTSSVAVVEGEAGIGKSRLVEDLAAQARTLGVATAMGAGDAIERATPYHAWRPVFNQLLALGGAGDADTRRARALARLEAVAAGGDAAARADLLRLAPLLDDVLGLDLPENDLTAAMAGEARADNTQHLLERIVEQAAANAPLLLIVEDAHWLDSNSWALLGRAGRRVPHLMLVVATRPLAEPLPADYRRLREAPGTLRLALEALAPDDAVALVRRRLGVTSLPESVAELIRSKAGGHPFFSEELAYALRDSGVLLIEGGECRLAPGAADLSALAFPDTVQGVIASRIDHLTAAQQLTLKVASVIGRLFAFRTLRDLHPTDESHLKDDLETLRTLDLTPLDRPEPDLTYLFKHIITQEVAYNLLLYAQRRQLHRAVAEWYERTYAADLSPHAPLLAHHWRRAIDSPRAEPDLAAKAIAYFEQAGEQAVRSYANVEVVRFLSEALALDDARDDTHDDTRAPGGTPESAATRSRRAHWHRLLGDAEYRLGHVAAAKDHLQRAIALLGQTPPTSRGRSLGLLLTNLGRQAAHLAVPRVFAGRAPRADRERLLEAARAYETLAVVLFLNQERLACLAANLRCLNLAEAAGPSAELTYSYALAGLLAGALGLRRLTRRYFRQGLETGRAVGDRWALGRVWISQGCDLLGHADWPAARDSLRRALECFEAVGDRRWREQTLCLTGVIHQYLGEYESCAARYAEAHASAAQRGDPQAQFWAMTGEAYLHVHGADEQNERTLRSLEMAERWLGDGYAAAGDPSIATCAFGLRSLGHLRRGERALALACAARGAGLVDGSPPLLYHGVSGFGYVLDALLHLWATAPAGAAGAAERAALARHVAHLRRTLRKSVRLFPFALPQHLLLEGTFHQLGGRPDRAQRAWAAALAAAEAQRMWPDQAQIHFEIGRHLVAADPRRPAHLARAAELFARVGFSFDYARAVEAQKGTT